MTTEYEKLVKWDVIGKMERLFQAGKVHLRQDYKIDWNKTLPTRTSPWLFTGDGGQNCYIDHFIMMPIFDFIPSRCHKCWKVVITIPNVSALFKWLKVMRMVGYHGKCGIEGNRINSSKLYGSYFYTTTKEDGLKRYKQARKLVDKHLGEDVPVILKRGCTEFEQIKGDSKDWDLTPEQEEMEEIINEALVQDCVVHKPTRHYEAHIKLNWLRQAYQWGDETYKEFTGGRDMFPPLRSYHNEEEEGK